MPPEKPEHDALAEESASRRSSRDVFRELRIPRLLERFPARIVWAVYVLVNGAVTIGLLAIIARVSNTPFLFPSLGPTAYLLFLNPTDPGSSPRNTLLGHAVGILCGYGALRLLGLSDHPPATTEGVNAARIACAALALAATGAVMVLRDVRHAPAGATTLIIALGFITRPRDLFIIEAAVALLVGQGLVINRLAGIPYPTWSAPGTPPPEAN